MGQVFHPKWNVKRPNSIILLSEVDNVSFYFSHHLLSALSTFFAGIPAASQPQDTFDGTSVIPLDTTAGGLDIFLQTLQSTSSSEPFSLGTTDDLSAHIVTAARIGSVFDCPIIFRLLSEGVRQSPSFEPYTDFGIWVFARVPSKIAEAALATLDHKIVDAPKDMVSIMKQHALLDWAQLQDFHLRRLHRWEEFRQSCVPNEHDHPQFGHDGPCSDSDVDAYRKIADLISMAKTVEAVVDLRDCNYGLTCHHCIEEADDWYGDRIRTLVDLSLKY